MLRSVQLTIKDDDDADSALALTISQHIIRFLSFNMSH